MSETDPRPNLRVVTGDCEWPDCCLYGTWLVRRGTRRGEAVICCGRHLLASIRYVSEGIRAVTVTPRHKD